MKYRFTLCASAVLLSLVACSPKGSASQNAAEPQNASGAVDEASTPAVPSPTATAAPAPADKPASSSKIIRLEGLGDLRIGQPVPAGTTWAERGAQIDGQCRTVTSPDYRGVYAIVTGGKVRRITVGKTSDVTLIEGIGVGASEREVTAAFPGFRAEPHKYEDAPAKYLTAPNAKSGDPALRFEIGHDGKVSLIHIGTMPVLAYVEGCA